jgi:aminoglycoside phosphotransferase (APT) family kinase protein
MVADLSTSPGAAERSSRPSSVRAASVTDEQVRQLLVELCGVKRIASLGPGPASYSSRLWLADTDEGPLLVRVPQRTHDPEYVRAALVATRIASEASIPTVRFRAYEPRSSLGLPVVIQEYRPGEKAEDALHRGDAKLSDVATTLGTWLGILHGIGSEHFGSVLASSTLTDWPSAVRARVVAALGALEAEQLPAGRDVITSAFERALGALSGTEPASLVHADLYLDNVLVEQGRAAALIDFEHASYADRFAELGKLSELVFTRWPGFEEPFFEAYSAYFPRHRTDEARRRVGLGLYELTQLAYFARWQLDLVPVYRKRLENWLISE